MSLKAYEENDIQNIANAIRNKNITGNFTVAQMASNIDNIEGSANYTNCIVLKSPISIQNVDIDNSLIPSGKLSYSGMELVYADSNALNLYNYQFISAVSQVADMTNYANIGFFVNNSDLPLNTYLDLNNVAYFNFSFGQIFDRHKYTIVRNQAGDFSLPLYDKVYNNLDLGNMYNLESLIGASFGYMSIDTDLLYLPNLGRSLSGMRLIDSLNDGGTIGNEHAIPSRIGTLYIGKVSGYQYTYSQSALNTVEVSNLIIDFSNGNNDYWSYTSGPPRVLNISSSGLAVNSQNGFMYWVIQNNNGGGTYSYNLFSKNLNAVPILDIVNNGTLITDVVSANLTQPVSNSSFEIVVNNKTYRSNYVRYNNDYNIKVLLGKEVVL